MAQPFSLRYPLIDGQGNYGSVDGDSPAAMRYTEARLQGLAEAMMADLDKETVDFVPNYDETTDEPTVLPTPFPNLLVNGSTGIAVGMATNIPPHNLREVIEAVIGVINLTLEDEEAERTGQSTGKTKEERRLERQRHVLKSITGPDFPGGRIIIGHAGIHSAYTTGRGSITLRAKTEIEPIGKSDRMQIVATEIPYQVNKADLQKKIADLVHEKVLEGISDIRDESDRDGVRVVIELKKGEVPDVVLNNLFKHTQFQTTFGVITLAIVSGRPRVLPLVDLLDHFVEFRRDVVRRRIEFELKKAEARAHILEGLAIALDDLDAVIALIRASASPVLARDGLMTRFGLTQIQSQAILDMQLQRLTGLERQKILDELAALKQEIERLRTILGSRRLLMEIVVNELREIEQKYGNPRRTSIVDDPGEIRIEDLIADEDMAITVSNTGYIKRTSLDSYSQQRRGGKGRRGMDLREEDFVSHLFVASTHAYIMIFSDRGRAYWLKVYEIPDVGPANRGKAIANLVSMEPGEKIAALLAVREFPAEEDQQYIVMGTRKGVVKKTDLKAYANPRAGGIIAMGIEDDDALLAVAQTDGRSEVLIGTKQGQSIRFPEEDARPMGRTAYGVRGILLKDDDEVVAMEVVRPGGTVLTVTANGYGKRTALEEYRLQSRGGSGIINIQTSDRNGVVVGISYVSDEHELMLITQQGQTLRMCAKDVRVIGRATQGVKLIGVAEGDQVVSIVRLEDQGDATVNGGTPVDGEVTPDGGVDTDASVTPPESSADVTPPTGDDEPTE